MSDTGEQWSRRFCWIFAAAVCAVALPSCTKVSLYEQDLVVAKCALVERMEVATMIKSDEAFDVGVTCPGASGDSHFHRLLRTQDSSEYGLVLTRGDGATAEVTVFYCPGYPKYRSNPAGLSSEISELNKISSRTGITFVPGPAVNRCADYAAAQPGALAGQSSKAFDRQIK